MIEIEIRRGDITELACDALVNAANNRLWMGGGVAGALKRTGGQEIEVEAMKQGPVPVGNVVVTGAGKLKAKYVIHAAVMGQDLETDTDKIRMVTENCLLKADELGLHNLAFPALGTGVGGFPLAECARIMMDEVSQYSARARHLQKVVFVLYDQGAFQIFRREREKIA